MTFREAEPFLCLGKRYRVQTELQCVWGLASSLAVDEVDDRLVVVKTCRHFTPKLLAQLHSETERLSWLRVETLVASTVSTHDDLLLMVRPYFPRAEAGAPSRVSLAELLAQRVLTLEETMLVASDVLRALNEAHNLGVLHRGLRPTNVLIREEQGAIVGAVLVDFGCSLCASLDSLSSIALERVQSMAPEQSGVLDRGVDERSDLYGLGCLIFSCLVGQPPFAGSQVGELLRRQTTESAPSLRSRVQVPLLLDEMVARLLRPDPEERYQVSSGLLYDLELLREAIGRGESEPHFVLGLHDLRKTLLEPDFMGRQSELAALGSLLEPISEGAVRLVLLEACSGGGKTRMLEEFTQQARLRGTWALQGECLDQGQPPFHLLDGICQELLRDTSLADRVREDLGDHTEAVCASLPQLRPLWGEGSKEAPEEFGVTRTLSALGALLEVLATPQRPVVALFDDCQWADDMTLRLLASWWRAQDRVSAETAARGLLVVVSFRAEEVGPEHPLRHLKPSKHICLAPFTAEEVGALVESMAGSVPPVAVARIAELSGGNPFMVVALLRGLVETGALRIRQGAWQLEDGQLAGVQPSCQAAHLLGRRFRMLSPRTLNFLTTGAVLGKEFDVQQAVRLAALGTPEIPEVLAEALERSLVWLSGDASRAIFVHDQLRQTLLSSLTDEERRDWHTRAALLLESESPEQIFELAYQFDSAGQPDRALPYALQAAARARSQYALEIAERQYRIAQRGCAASQASTSYILQVADGLGDVLMMQGRYDEAQRHVEQALFLASNPLEGAIREGKLGELAFKRGDVKTGSEAFERGLRLLGCKLPSSRWARGAALVVEFAKQIAHTVAPSSFLGRRSWEGAERERTAVRLFNRLAQVYFFQRSGASCLWAHLTGMNLAETFQPSPELAQAWSQHGAAMGVFPWTGRALAYERKALRMRDELGDRWGRGATMHLYAYCLGIAGRYREALQVNQEAIGPLERSGDLWGKTSCRYLMAYDHYRLGNLREAVEICRSVYQEATEVGDHQAQGFSLGIWGRASQGQAPAELIEQGLRRFSEDTLVYGVLVQAEATRLLRLGHYQRAAALLEEALERVERAGTRAEATASLYPWLATARRQSAEQVSSYDIGGRDFAIQQAWKAARRAVRVARYFRNNLPHALRELGLVAALRGDAKRAQRALQESLGAAETLEARYERAQTLLSRGMVGQPLGWPGAAQEAEQGARELEALEWRNRELSNRSSSRLALADRFATLLEAGRRVAVALTREDVFEAVEQAFRSLLRGDHCLIVGVPFAADPKGLSPASLEQAARHGRPFRLDHAGALAVGVRSALFAPILARGRCVACVYTTSQKVTGLFGEDEERLAEFITVLAGGALENADGFAEVQALSRELESRVEIRTQELHRSGAELAVSLSLLQATLESTADGILVLDKGGHVQAHNQNFWRMWELPQGLEQERMFQQVAAQLRDGEAFLKTVQTVLAEPGADTFETLDFVDGRVFESYSKPQLLDGQVVGRVWSFRDVTAQRESAAALVRSEEHLREAQKIEAVGQLAGGVAHNFNNLLTVIMGYTDLLRSEVTDPEQSECLGFVREASQEAAKMTRQLLTFSRKQVRALTLLQANDIIRELQAMIVGWMGERSEVRFSLATELDCFEADPGEIRQVLMNLVSNAKDAMPEGGKLLILTRCAQLTVEEIPPDMNPGPYVCLSVRDTGVGMDEAVRSRVFEPFFTTKEPGSGTGLGLSMLYGVVQQSGGFTQITSEPGKGTEFALFFPASGCPQPRPAIQAAAEVYRRLSSRAPLATVLVVDDEPEVRRVSRMLLEREGYQVLEAGDGSEALSLLATHPQRAEIRLVLTDVVMPGLSGIQLAQKVIEQRSDMRFLFMSGYSADLAIEERLLLAKPFTSDELVSRVTEVLT